MKLRVWEVEMSQVLSQIVFKRMSKDLTSSSNWKQLSYEDLKWKGPFLTVVCVKTFSSGKLTVLKFPNLLYSVRTKKITL